MVAQLVKKFPDLHGTRKFIIVFISHGKAYDEDEDGPRRRTEAAYILNKQSWIAKKRRIRSKSL
jgi:hypothetical protein